MRMRLEKTIKEVFFVGQFCLLRAFGNEMTTFQEINSISKILRKMRRHDGITVQ